MPSRLPVNLCIHLLITIALLWPTWRAAAAPPQRTPDVAVKAQPTPPANQVSGRRSYLPITFGAPTAPPTADFAAERTNGYAPLTVTFRNRSDHAASAQWDFGDSGTATALNPTHTYMASGVYTVTLTVTNSLGRDTLTRPAYITVNDPALDFSVAQWAGTAPFTVTFSSHITGALGLTDTLAAAVYQWDFGDGSPASAPTAAVTATHVYTQAGVYPVTLGAVLEAGGVRRQLQTQRPRAVIVTDPVQLTMAWMTPAGGTLTSANGRVRLDFAPGALAQPYYISMDHLDLTEVVTRTVDGQPQRQLPPGDLPFHTIDLLAHDPETLSGVEVQFSAPVTLTFFYADALDAALGVTETVADLVDESTLHFTLFDAASQRYAPLPSTVVSQTAQPHIVTALTHFSNYGVTGDRANWVTPSLEAASVQLSRGSSSYAYPIPLPAGPGGFAPQMALQYSSGVVNGLVGDEGTDTGWVGLGWTLELGQVVKDEQVTLNSISGELQKGGDGFYYLESDTSVRVRQVASTQPRPAGVTEWVRNVTYEVVTKEGTTYTFGATSGLDGAAIGSTLTVRKVSDGRCQQYSDIFKLARVTDIHGNTLEITYDEYPGMAACATTAPAPVRESYPRQMRYTTNAAAGDTHAEYVVEFETAAKGYNPYAKAKTGDGSRKLVAIQIYYQPLSGSRQLVRRLELGYETNVAERTNRLTSLQLVGTDGAATLPATRFGYTRQQIGWKRPFMGDISCGPDTSNPSCYRPLVTATYQRAFLSRIENGYGGEVAFAYATEDDSGQGLYQLVQSQTITDSIGGLVNQQRFYYGSANLNWLRNNGRNVSLSYGRFFGFAHAEVEDALGRWTHHQYNNGRNDILNGYELATWFYAGHPASGGALYRHSALRYVAQPWPVPRNDKQKEEEDKTRFVYLAEEQSYQCEGASGGDLSGCLHLRTTRTVDVWGNPSGQQVYAADGRLYRQSRTGYFQQQWLFRPAWSETLDGAGQRIALSRSGYDNQPPTTALEPLMAHANLLNLTHNRAWAGNSLPSQGRAGEGYLDSAYTYDAYGNPLSETLYNAYGTASAYAAADARTTRTQYDSHGLFPIQVVNPLGHTVTSVYDYRFQQPNQVTDPNGAVTRTSFDPFGRTQNVTLPAVAGCGAEPDFSAVYADAAASSFTPAAPYFEQAQQRIDDCTGAPVYATTTVYYDGLGRKIQAHTPGDDAATVIVTDVAFDVVGRLTHTGQPYTRLADQPPMLYTDQRTLDAGLWTITTYDALDRPLTVTTPDQRVTRSAYALENAARLLTTVTDANGHQKQQVSDEFGRLIEVREFIGDSALYATMRYGYDTRDNLVQVTDAHGNVTTIGYDALNRKTSMDDPDMGLWTYAYDALGNLVTQTDAKGTVTTLQYDALNRLITKSYADATADVTYHYDSYPGVVPEPVEGRNTIGRLTVMDDETGFVATVYDARGRITDQQRLFDDATGPFAQLMANMPSGYVTSANFDAADRPTQLIYPDGEVVTTAYTQRGLPARLSSSQRGVLIEQTQYNALGQMTQRTAGNGVVTQYKYYTAQQHNNRLQQMIVGPSTGSGTGDLLNFAYQYDAVGNITALIDAAVGIDGEIQRFTYDPLDRLVNAQTENSTRSYHQVYAYDEVGNILAKGMINATTPYAYRGSQPHAVTSVGEDVYQYDANGNMTQRLENGIEYTQRWNAFNKLASIEWRVAGVPCRTEFVYDGDGNRLLKVENMLNQFDGGQALQLTTLYVGGIYERQFNTTVNPVGETVSGAIPDGVDPIMACQGDTDSQTDYGYTGQRNESGFGLMDYNARMYSARLGRFISPDSLIPDPTSGGGFNRFAYVLNNPLKYQDPSGHCPRPDGEYAEANIICVAGFIPTETSTGIPAIPFVTDGVYFQGDNRDFSSNSAKTASRFWLWIDADSGTLVGHPVVHPTQRVSGPNSVPVGPPSPPRSSATPNPIAEAFFGSNSISTELLENGSIVLNYSVVCSDPICNNMLAPNGSITFTPNEFGSFDSFGVVDSFPNLEAYHWNNGQLQNKSLFTLQNFSANELSKNHADAITSFGMASPAGFTSSFNNPEQPEITRILSVDGQPIFLGRR